LSFLRLAPKGPKGTSVFYGEAIMIIRTRVQVLVGFTALAMLLACASSAQASKAVFSGEAPHPKPGQRKEFPILMGFELRGNHCPKGPHCFDHATVSNFDAVGYAFPNCPDLIDSAFEFKKDSARRANKSKPHSFTSGGISFQSDRVKIHGHFYHGGTKARGWFTVLIHPFSFGCTTGKVFWQADLYAGPPL
jgi:hypothetical protein